MAITWSALTLFPKFFLLSLVTMEERRRAVGLWIRIGIVREGEDLEAGVVGEEIEMGSIYTLHIGVNENGERGETRDRGKMRKMSETAFSQ